MVFDQLNVTIASAMTNLRLITNGYQCNTARTACDGEIFSLSLSLARASSPSGIKFDNGADLLFQYVCVYIRCENTMRPNIIFLCFFVLIQIYVQHTTESFATPKEKLLAEFNLAECCSFRLCDFGRRTFSKMHANHSKRTNTTTNMNIHFECVATK